MTQCQHITFESEMPVIVIQPELILISPFHRG